MNTLLEVRLDRLHVSNSPRKGDVVQCRECAKTWPCDVRLLLDRIDDLREKLRVRK
jgi:hypothetical protein